MELSMLGELEAMNTVLASIGAAPVNMIPTEGVSEAMTAHNRLLAESRIVQDMQPRCSQVTLEIQPETVTGYILVPKNILNVECLDLSEDVSLRGNKIFDHLNNTYTFDHALKLNLTLMLSWTELPQHVRQYITVKAARAFQLSVMGSGGLDHFSKQDEDEARETFWAREMSNRPTNWTHYSPEMQYALDRRL